MDRNINAQNLCVCIMSLSARRAWIEIACPLGPQAIYPVALRKESVDRNLAITPTGHGQSTSLSARRAWIEILTRRTFAYVSYVALRKESVDRNYAANAVDQILPGRSPQGERG